MEIKRVSGQVEACLLSFPRTRDSDILLRQQIIKSYYPEKIYLVNGKEAILFEDEFGFPTQEAVKRIRAKFNEQGKYLTSNPQIRKQRKQKEVEWRQNLGYNN